MNRDRPDKITLIFLLFLIPVWGYSQTSNGKWDFQQRIILGFENDNNVREQVGNNAVDNSLRFTLDSKISYKENRYYFQFSYLGGLQVYNEFAGENKVIHEPAVVFYGNSKESTAGIKIGGRSKHINDNNTGYYSFYINPFWHRQLFGRTILQTGVNFDMLDYSYSSLYDYYDPAVYLKWLLRFSQVTIVPNFSAGQVYLNRKAILADSAGYSMGNEKQKDVIFSGGIFLDAYLQQFLINLSYNFVHNNSNSSGSSYSKHVFQIIAAKQFRFFMLRSYVTIEKKNYLDPFQPGIPIDLDPERNQSNYVVIDFSRDFSRILASFRFAWYKNESIIPTQYYEKMLTSINLEFHL